MKKLLQLQQQKDLSVREAAKIAAAAAAAAATAAAATAAAAAEEEEEEVRRDRRLLLQAPVRAGPEFKIFGFRKFPMLTADEVDALKQEFDQCHGASNMGERVFPTAFETPTMYRVFYGNPRLYEIVDSCFMSDKWLCVNIEGFKITGTSAWHRDFASDLTHVKLNVYLDDCSHGGGLCFLPGSHIHDDQYSLSVGRYLNWPQGGGLALVKTDVPAVDSRPALGDVTVFDTNIVHGSTANPNVATRRCISLLFVAWPDDAEWQQRVLRWYGVQRMDRFLADPPRDVLPARRDRHFPNVLFAGRGWERDPDYVESKRWDHYARNVQEHAITPHLSCKNPNNPLGGI